MSIKLKELKKHVKRAMKDKKEKDKLSKKYVINEVGQAYEDHRISQHDFHKFVGLLLK